MKGPQKGIVIFFVSVALCSTIAWIVPQTFLWVGNYITWILGLIMYGMGLSLRWGDFGILRQYWKLIIAGVVLQYTVMPLISIGLSFAFSLPLPIFYGMLVVGACPGGTASNVMVYFAKGNVALSILLTFFSTMLSPLLTPIIIYGVLHQEIELSFWELMKSPLFIVILPVILGMITKSILKEKGKHIMKITPIISIAGISCIIAFVLGKNKETLEAMAILTYVAIALHNVLGLLFGYIVAKWGLKTNASDARTLAIEVGMQNSGLGAKLLIAQVKVFGVSSLVPAAFFSVWHNVTGVLFSFLKK